MKSFQKGQPPKGKNLLLQEQIISFKELTSPKREAKMKVAELIPLKGYLFLFTLKAPNKNSSRRHFNFLLLSFEENRIHLKHQVLFSPKNNEKIFLNVVCCSHDWHFKG